MAPATIRKTPASFAPVLTARAARVLAVLAIAMTLVSSAPATAFASDAHGEGALPSSVPLLIVVVGFEGDGSPESAVPYRDEYDWSAFAFDRQDSVATYYADMSGGLFTFAPARETSAFSRDGNTNERDRADDGVVHVTLPSPHGQWATVNEDIEVTRSFCRSALDALQQAGAYVDFASYDADGNGTLAADELAIVFCIAGYEASAVGDYQTSSLPLVWAHSGSLEIAGTAESTIGGLRFGPYVTMAEQYWIEGTSLDEAEQEPSGLLCHELGHTLGLPDLYAIDDGSDVSTWAAYEVGTLSLMATGGWVGTPEYHDATFYLPGALDAWSRYKLGWVEPTVVRESGDYLVSSQLSGRGYSQLLVPTADPDRYYLIENRQPEGYDENIAGSFEGDEARGGIVIWLVDEKLCDELDPSNTVNATSHHPGVMQLFCEVSADSGEYSQDWATSQPVLGQPFYDSGSWSARFGEGGSEALELPAYADGAADTPAARTYSGARVGFASESSRDMTVHIELTDELRAHALAQMAAEWVGDWFGDGIVRASAK